MWAKDIFRYFLDKDVDTVLKVKNESCVIAIIVGIM